ncbi:MAG: hypothetical protein HKN14_11130 [Marinicaulis sp.]|nr:hypothetical protein [Marinicaulis sp.]
MTLENIYYIGQTIAVIALIISLIFVGIQVRQSKQQTEQANRLAKAQLSEATWIAIGNFQVDWYSTPERSKFMARALLSEAPLEDHEKLRFNINLTTLFSAIELSATLKEQDLFNEALYGRNERTIAAYFKVPRVQKWWTNVGRQYFTSPFRDTVDDIARQTQRASVEKLVAKAGQGDGADQGRSFDSEGNSA